ncbi:MAG: glycine--tRNA ligase, partial [Candidatus Diapherotrites archaeon]
MDKNKDFAEKLTSYLKEKAYFYGPEPELYGGLAGFYAYGPLGKRLKNKIEEKIRAHFNKEGFFEIEYPLITPAIVWKASGHLENFKDPVILTEDKKESYRADKLIEETTGIRTEGLTEEEMIKIIQEKNIKSPTGKKLIPQIEKHSLMMKTTIGTNTEAYNRPETATTTYLLFKNYLEFFRDKLPFGVFQIGKAFRNEISPRQHVIRSREFTQAESQTILMPETKNEWEKYEKTKKEKMPLWTEKQQKEGKEPQMISLEEAINKKILKNKAFAWHLNLAYKLFASFGIKEIRLRQHHENEKAFYSEDTWDIEAKLKSFGWIEMCGISDRTDYDLKQHSKYSGQKLTARNEKGEEKTPHVIEIAFGIDRPIFAILDNVYEERPIDEQRTILKLKPSIAPIQVGIFPLVKKDGLAEIAKKIHEELTQKFLCYYDETGSIGRRYSRQDAYGTPYCITIDYQTKEDNTITIRDRDTMKQERIKITEIKKYLEEK